MRASHIILLEHDAGMAEASSLDEFADWACERVEELVSTPEEGRIVFDWVASEAFDAVEFIEEEPSDITYAEARAEFLSQSKFASSHFGVESAPEKIRKQLRRVLKTLSSGTVETISNNDLAHQLRTCANYAATGLPGVEPKYLFDPTHGCNSDMREPGGSRGPWALIKFDVRFSIL